MDFDSLYWWFASIGVPLGSALDADGHPRSMSSQKGSKASNHGNFLHLKAWGIISWFFRKHIRNTWDTELKKLRN